MLMCNTPCATIGGTSHLKLRVGVTATGALASLLLVAAAGLFGRSVALGFLGPVFDDTAGSSKGLQCSKGGWRRRAGSFWRVSHRRMAFDRSIQGIMRTSISTNAGSTAMHYPRQQSLIVPCQ